MSIPGALRQFDAAEQPRCDEQVVVQILWSCLEGLSSLPRQLGHPQGAVYWDKGTPGCGDLIGRPYDGGPAYVHIEIKSAQAEIHYGSKCPHECRVRRSQFEHMAHDQKAVIQAFTHTWRMPKLTGELAALGLGSRVQVRSFEELADAVEQSLAQDGAPQYDLVWSLLDGPLP